MNDLENIYILIVEDEKIVAWDIQETIERMGYNVLDNVPSGKEAIQKASLIKPDLVLMDIRLEGTLSGIEAANLLYRSFNIPVVYLTALSDDETLRQAINTNPFGYVIKPFQPQDLYSTIEIALQRHQQESDARLNQQWLSNLLNSIGGATIATGQDGIITFINAIAAQMTGWRQQEALGKPINLVLKLISQFTGEIIPYPKMMPTIRSDDYLHGSKRCLLRDRDGDEIIVDYVITPISKWGNDVIIGSVILFQNATSHILTNSEFKQLVNERTSQLELINRQLQEEIRQRQDSEQKVEKLFIRDELTGLYNRRGFFQLAEQKLKLALRVKGSVCLIFIDLDGLKKINDTHGHQIGDQIIMAATQVLKNTFRESDVIARLGGDEFAIFIPDCSTSDQIYPRLQENLSRFNQSCECSYHLSMSIGLVISQVNVDTSLEMMLKEADKLMSIHKKSKRFDS